MVRDWITLMKAVAFLGIWAGFADASETGRFATAGEVGGDTIATEVDSQIARYFLENYLQGKRTNPRFDARIDSILQEAARRTLTNESLKAIAERTSPDFGAMLFAHLQTQRNLEIKQAFLREYGLAKQGRIDLRYAAERYKIVLVPGLFHRSKPETKGDLREVKATLAAEGIEVVSVPILDAGTVEQNARIIADFIKNEPVTHKQLILVSTSKGGPETLYALGHLISTADGEKIALWFSIGGALRGSFLADRWTRWPSRWLVAVIGLFKGFSTDMVASLSDAASKQRMEQIHISPQIGVVHFVGVPLSGTVIDEVRESYKALLPYGPNDGITLLPDELLDGETVITALGLDHWYRDPDLRRKILGLLVAVTRDRPRRPTPIP